MKTYKLSDVLGLNAYMHIPIDGEVETDANGNFIINIGYTRVSTDKQADEGFGLDIQNNVLLDYCQRNRIKNLAIFTDDGYTGTKMDRPALQGIIKMITDFNNGKSKIRIGTMVIPKIDRLGRTMLGTLQFIQDYIVCSKDSMGSTVNKNEEDINFVSVEENYCRIEKNNPQGKFLLMLFASLAEFDRDLIVQKLKRGRQQRAASGRWQGGGKAPYGYTYDANKGELFIVPEQAAKVREVFRLYIEEKLSPQKIADRLGFSSEKVITDILKRKLLAGYITRNGEEYLGIHEPIISIETWLDAQDEIESRKVVRGDSNYLLSGLLVCGECGAKMRYQKWSKKSGECKMICYSQQGSKSYLVKDENCDNERYWQSDVESAVIAELFRLTYLGNEDNKKSAKEFDPIEALNEELKIEKKKLSRYYLLFADGMDDDVLRENMQTSQKRIGELEHQLQSEIEQIEIKRKVSKAKNIFKTLEGTWEHMTQAEKQAVCRELIEDVVIHKNGVVDVHLKLRSYLINKE